MAVDIVAPNGAPIDFEDSEGVRLCHAFGRDGVLFVVRIEKNEAKRALTLSPNGWSMVRGDLWRGDPYQLEQYWPGATGQ